MSDWNSLSSMGVWHTATMKLLILAATWFAVAVAVARPNNLGKINYTLAPLLAEFSQTAIEGEVVIMMIQLFFSKYS